MSVRAPLIALLVVGTVVACGSSRPPFPPDDEAATWGRTSAAIVGGEVDKTHPAVVSVTHDMGGCSGTIVKTDPARRIGWVVTAAHCVSGGDPRIVTQGEDAASPDALDYYVIDYTVDARYKRAPSGLCVLGAKDFCDHDLMVLRIGGVDAETETMPLVDVPDNLVVGTPIMTVGFGLTNADGGRNTKRNVIAGSLSEVLETEIVDKPDPSGRSFCSGDSGGPVVVKVLGKDRVAGVVGFGGCPRVPRPGPADVGVSARVAASRAFLDGELAKALPPESCSVCTAIARSGKQECAGLYRACTANTDCGKYATCIVDGKSKASCFEQFPTGEGPYEAMHGCPCNRACKDSCGPTFDCQLVPACGFALGKDETSRCVEGACCAEISTCAASGACYVCLKSGDKDPGCAKIPERRALATCAAKCSAPSADDAGSPGAGTAAPASDAPPHSDDCSAGLVGGTSSGSGVGAFVLAAAVAWRRRRRASAQDPRGPISTGR